MEVILKEDFPQLGYVGDIVRVKNGFARNYLIPQGIALPYAKDKKSRKYFNHLLRRIQAKKDKLKIVAEQQAEKLKELELQFILKLGEKGKAFGSITSRDIEVELNKQGITSVTRKQIKLQNVIKRPGVYQATIALHSEVSVDINVNVEGVQDKAGVVVKKEDSKEAGSLPDDLTSNDSAESNSEDDTNVSTSTAEDNGSYQEETQE